jgi:integrase
MNQAERRELLHGGQRPVGGMVYRFSKALPQIGQSKESSWLYVFPSLSRSVDPVSKRTKRHHLDVTVVQKAVRQAVLAAGLDQPISPHTIRQRAAYL